MAKKICRSAVALAVFCTCLTLMASPASANGKFYAVSRAGTLKIQSSSATAQIPLTTPETGGDFCVSAVTLFETTKPSSRSIRVRSSTFKNRFSFNNTTYISVVKMLTSTDGSIPTSITSDHSTVNSSNTVRVSFFTPMHVNNSTSCETNGAALCEWTAAHAVGLAWSKSTPLTEERELLVSNPGGAATMANHTAGCSNAPFSPFAPPNTDLLQQFDNTPKWQILSTERINIEAGKITLTKTGITPEVLDLDPLAGGNCGDGALGLTLTGTSISGTSFTSSGVRTFGTAGTFLAVFTRSTVGNTAGILNTTVTPHTVSNMRVAVVMTVYNTTDCTPIGTPMCTVAVLLNLSGTLTGTTPGSELDLTGSSVGNVVAYPTCTSGPSYLVGSAATVTDPIAAELP